MEAAEGLSFSSTPKVIFQGVELHKLDNEPGEGSALEAVPAVAELVLLSTRFPHL